MVYPVFKRLADVLVSGLALIALSPVLLLVSVGNAKYLGRPVLFTQVRPGKSAKLFTMYKFRTMTDARDVDGNLLPDVVRLHPWGKFLRSTSLDELPELWNVLKGDMSIIGPRPLLPEYLEHYTPTQNRRHEVRPGITGLAQVLGRNELAWEDKFAYDVTYVDELNFLLDVKILTKTLISVFKREGINTSDGTSMPKFGTDA